MRFAGVGGVWRVCAVGVLLTLVCGHDVRGATTFSWQPTTGGDLADGANWNQGGAAPGGSTTDTLVISRDQSAPLTLGSDIDVCDQNYNIFAFTGDFDFGTPARTLRAGCIFQRGNDKTTRLLRGTLNVGNFYQEDGSIANGHGNTFILDSPDARMEASSFVGVGTKPRNNTFVVTNGAALVTSSLSVGRDAYTYSAGIVASNNLLHVTGEGTAVTVLDLLSTGIRQDNRIEIDDHAVVTAKNVRLAVSNYDNEGDRHLYDSAKRLRIAGGARLICNPTGGFVNGEPRLTVGWHTGSNMLEVADGGELICYTNRVVVGNYWSSAEGTTAMTDFDPAYRFAGNCLRVTGKDSKVRIFAGGPGNPGVLIAPGDRMHDQCIEVLDGAFWHSSGEFWVSTGCNNGVYVGKGARFEHEVYDVQIGISGNSTNAYFVVDGGVYAPTVSTALGGGGQRGRFDVVGGGLAALTNGSLTVGGTGSQNWMTVSDGGRMMTSNVALTVTSGSGGANVFAVTNGGTAVFDLGGSPSRKHFLCAHKNAQGGTILVDGAGSVLDFTSDTVVAIPQGGGMARGAHVVVSGGGTLKFGTLYLGDQGEGSVDCGMQVSNGVMEVSGYLHIGGSDYSAPHGCWMTVAGADTDIRVGVALSIARDSTLTFDVPTDGFATVPVKTRWLVFGTQCATRPALRVRCSLKNRVNRVTLVEATSDISLPADLNVDLPPGARLLQSGDVGYDAKKLTVKLPVPGLTFVLR